MDRTVTPLAIATDFLGDLSNHPPKNLRDSRLYVNRELSQLAFQQRVLSMVADDSIKLLERLRFLCISRSLLDEFFEVRVAALRQRIEHGAARPGPDGITPRNTQLLIRQTVQALVADQFRLYGQVLRPELEREGIRFLTADHWTTRQERWLHEYFRKELMPVLSPLGLDPAHPFPRILSKSLNLLVELSGRDAFGREGATALVRAPRSLPRLIRIPKSYARSAYDFVFLSSILQRFMPELFPGMSVVGSHQFRVTRDSELLVDEEEIEDLASALQRELADRGFASAVRLEIRNSCPSAVEKTLAARFDLGPEEVYRCDGPVNLYRLSEALEQIDRPDLCYPPLRPHVSRQLAHKPNLFNVIRKQDVLLHHPYESFSPLLELLRQAATDPDVLAIKQTLYRTGIDSQVVHHLLEAARHGKDVTVVVELRARFDEEANISLASRLQEAGVQVVYGVVGFKAHAKMLMIVRRERRRIRRYVHLGTGNYHSGTAKHYTDLGLLTCHAEIGEDVHHVFQQLSGLGKVQKLTYLLNSPFTLYRELLKKIEREAANAKAGRPSGIDAKLNALTDPGVIKALYAASKAGVPIRLLVRGMCCLRPGIPGVSETIRVRSIIGRFLEHSRIYSFENNGDPEVWCSSADWMERNLHQRVEVAFPIFAPAIRQRVRAELDLPWEDGMRAWDMQADGEYLLTNPTPDGKWRDPQKRLLKLTRK